MPELPEVEVILHQLKESILFETIASFTIHRPDILRTGHEWVPWLRDSLISSIERHGKCLIFTCERSGEKRYLLSELGMTGLWLFRASLATSPQHIHAQMGLSRTNGFNLFYWNPRRFGRLWLLTLSEIRSFRRRRFGLDALEFKEDSFIQLIQSAKGRLKPLLLNQHRIAGIGNIYANEILFRARLHPQARGCRLRKSSCNRLYSTMRTVLQEAIDQGGSSIRDFQSPEGRKGQFQNFHQVYQKDGHMCPQGCHTLIQRIQQERTSFICPTCQKKR